MKIAQTDELKDTIALIISLVCSKQHMVFPRMSIEKVSPTKNNFTFRAIALTHFYTDIEQIM
jgi:hypothetical protein